MFCDFQSYNKHVSPIRDTNITRNRDAEAGLETSLNYFDRATALVRQNVSMPGRTPPFTACKATFMHEAPDFVMLTQDRVLLTLTRVLLTLVCVLLTLDRVLLALVCVLFTQARVQLTPVFVLLTLERIQLTKI